MISINVGIINNNNNITPLTKQQVKAEQLQTGLAELFALMLGIQTTETEIVSTITDEIESKQDTELKEEMVTTKTEDNEEETSPFLAYSLPILHKAPEIIQIKQSVVHEDKIRPEQTDKIEPKLQTLQIQSDKSEIPAKQQDRVDSILKVENNEDYKTTVELPYLKSEAKPQNEVKNATVDEKVISDVNTVKPQIKTETIKVNEQFSEPIIKEVKTQIVAEIKKELPKIETEKQKDAQFQTTIKSQPFVFENEIEVVAKKDEAPVLPQETVVLLATEVKRASVQGLTEITLQLKPEGLGRVVINLKKTSEKLEVILKTELDDTNRLIKSKLDVLRSELNLNQIEKYTTTVVLETQETNLFNTNTSTTHSNAFENPNRSFTGNKEDRIDFRTDKNIEQSAKNANVTKTINYRKGKFDLRI